MTNDAAPSLNTPGERLRALRKSRGFRSANELAERLGMAPSVVRSHENGQNGIRGDTIELYAQALGVSPSYIAYGEGGEDGPARDVVAGPTRSGPLRVTQLTGNRYRVEIDRVVSPATMMKIVQSLQDDGNG